ncbi:DEAD/DEAH box helicase [Azospirillum palustre]
MSEKLKEHLSKQGAATLSPLLGQQVVELLTHVGHEALAPQVMADLIITSRGAASILKDDVIRQILVERLSVEDAKNLCEVLGMPDDAPRMTLNGVNFNRPKAASTLFEWYGVPYAEKDDESEEPSRNVPSQEKLWIYQEAAYRKLRRLLEKVDSRVLVHMPFGAGKVRTVVTAVLEAFRSESEDKAILWLAPGACLCEEVLAELEAVWNQLGLRDITSYRLFGGRKIAPLDAVSNALIVADIKSFRDAMSDWQNQGLDLTASLAKFGERVKCVVLTDAEHIVLPELDMILSGMSVGGHFNVVGISASPSPAIEANIPMELMRDAFGGNFVEIEDDEPLAALRRSGEVDPINVTLIPSPIMTLDGTNDRISLPDSIVERLALDVARNKALLDKLVDMALQEDRIVFYATTAQQARMFAGLLGLKGTPASAVTGEMPPERRSQEMAKFNSDHKKQILCVHGALVSALVVKGIAAVVIALPTVSGALLHEMVGRLATRRKDPDKPLKVYAVGDPVPGYLRLVENLDRWGRLSL